MKVIKVNETLSVEGFPAGATLRIIREDGGLVAVTLDEVRHLIAALNEGAARLASELAGEEYQDDLF